MHLYETLFAETARLETSHEHEDRFRLQVAGARELPGLGKARLFLKP